jgi:hypothetical protein
MVAYCSSCREERGRHTLRGSHPYFHDSRRRYLSDAYLENRNKEHKGIIPRGAMVTGGVCLMYLQHYIKVIYLVQKGRYYSEEDQRHLDRGSIPKEISIRGSIPKRRMALCH